MTVPRDISVLQYAKRLPWHRQRRWHRWIVIAILVISVLACWHWRMPAWRWAQVQYYQGQCLRYSRPTNQIVAVDSDPEEVIALAVKDWQYGVADSSGGRPIFAAHAAAPFDRLMAILQPPASACNGVVSSTSSSSPSFTVPRIPILFLHARKSKAGHDRLVAIFITHVHRARTSDFLCIASAVFECGIDGIRQINPEKQAILETEYQDSFGDEAIRFFAGQPDPIDSSRFTIDYIDKDLHDSGNSEYRGTIIGTLDDEEKVDLDDPGDPKGWKKYSGSGFACEGFSISHPFQNSEKSWNLQQWLILGNDAELRYVRDLTVLQSLKLGDKVTDDGLIQLKGLTTLQYLDLQGTHVTDAGLEHLKQLSCLRTLDLRNTKVTNSGVAELQKALPNCKIIR